MKRELFERIMKEKIVDTKQYRYVANGLPDKLVIKRLPVNLLDTTDAINSWQYVKINKA